MCAFIIAIIALIIILIGLAAYTEYLYKEVDDLLTRNFRLFNEKEKYRIEAIQQTIDWYKLANERERENRINHAFAETIKRQKKQIKKLEKKLKDKEGK